CAEIKGEKRKADVEAPGAGGDDATQYDNPAREGEVAAPLPRRDPRAGEEAHREDHAEVRGVEKVLAVDAQRELRGHAGRGRDGMHPQAVGAQQRRQPEAGHDGAQVADVPESQEANPQPLCGEASGEAEQHLLPTQAEVSRDDSGGEERRKEPDLTEPRVELHLLKVERVRISSTLHPVRPASVLTSLSWRSR